MADDIRIAFEKRCTGCPRKPGWTRGPLYPSYGDLVQCQWCRGTGYLRAGLLTIDELAKLIHALPQPDPEEST
jgi:hypothetical protein